MTSPNRIDHPGSGERVYWRNRYWEIKRQRGDRLLLLWCNRDKANRNRYQFALYWVTTKELEKDD